MTSGTLRRAILSPWTIGALLALGCGPIFVAELVRRAQPDLGAAYAPQAFAMGWMVITFFCSLFSIVLAIVYLVRLVSRHDDRVENWGKPKE